MRDIHKKHRELMPSNMLQIFLQYSNSAKNKVRKRLGVILREESSATVRSNVRKTGDTSGAFTIELINPALNVEFTSNKIAWVASSPRDRRDKKRRKQENDHSHVWNRKQ